MHLQLAPESGRVDQPKPISLVDGPLDEPELQDRRKIDKGPHETSDRNAIAIGEVTIGQGRAAVDVYSRPPTGRSRAHRDFDFRMRTSNPPERRGTAVAQHRIGTTGEHSCHPAPMER